MIAVLALTALLAAAPGPTTGATRPATPSRAAPPPSAPLAPRTPPPERKAPLTPAESMERQAAQHVVREFERVGRRAPTEDSALSVAARRLAHDALSGVFTGAPDLFTLTEAVSDAGAADPAPRALVIRAWAHAHALESLRARTDLNSDRATHFGVGVALVDKRAALVTLVSDRKAELKPFPRVMPGERAVQTLCGRLNPPLHAPEIYVTRPDGEVVIVPLTRRGTEGSDFCTRLDFLKPGTYTVEVVAQGDAGPEVTSLFLTQIGEVRLRGERENNVEPTTEEGARSALHERINALRRAHGLVELMPDPVLERVAQGYSTRMTTEGFFAHIAPDGSTLTRRLPPGSRYGRAGENLGQAAGPLAAHFGIEHSPGHRRNLLDPGFRFMGVGVVLRTVAGGRSEATVTEVFTAASPASADPQNPQQDAYDALARWRAAKKLPPLARSQALESLALAHARHALELDQPAAQPGEAPLHERVFRVLPDAGTASVDFFVVSDPAALPESRSVTEATNNRVGVGVVRGDSKRFGAKQYWVAVIYAAVQ
ncbi:CAP domain-containing protein [Myxococcus sp. CA040A]|uniref:CAP domain-containing protein n=1 Tax=Myxococcus sp. CA040A TaxID=2741738 RepID=UPI00157B8E4A|nr:CAP domain-containing protein [Myxococcus sp. CA040A]NTX02319.1 CAP domain-containing protein [Myxococcus sp. CA040A]